MKAAVDAFKNANPSMRGADGLHDVEFDDALNTCAPRQANGLPMNFTDMWATGAYHTDAVHVNRKGYCHVFNMPQMQYFLGCPPQNLNCDTF